MEIAFGTHSSNLSKPTLKINIDCYLYTEVEKARLHHYYSKCITFKVLLLGLKIFYNAFLQCEIWRTRPFPAPNSCCSEWRSLTSSPSNIWTSQSVIGLSEDRHWHLFTVAFSEHVELQMNWICILNCRSKCKKMLQRRKPEQRCRRAPHCGNDTVFKSYDPFLFTTLRKPLV